MWERAREDRAGACQGGGSDPEAVQGLCQGWGPHLGPPVGPSPERVALRTVVLRTSPDTWFGKKRRTVGVWKGKKSTQECLEFIYFFTFRGKKASSPEKGEESTAEWKRGKGIRRQGGGGDTGVGPWGSAHWLVHLPRGAPSRQGTRRQRKNFSARILLSRRPPNGPENGVLRSPHTGGRSQLSRALTNLGHLPKPRRNQQVLPGAGEERVWGQGRDEKESSGHGTAVGAGGG